MNLKNTILSVFIGLFIIGYTNAQMIITQWDFNNITPGDISTASPSTGAGDLSLIGGTTTPASGSSGVGSSDPSGTNIALQTTTYPSQSEDNQTAGIQIGVSTVDYENIELTFDLRLSNTASRWIQVQYSLDGTLFQNLGSPLRVGGMGDDSAGDAWTNQLNFDFSSIPGANNNPDFIIRVVTSFSSQAFTIYNTGDSFDADEAYEPARNPSSGSQSDYGGGTMRYDMVTLSGDPIIAGAAQFYSNGSGALNELTTWGTNPDGTGANPTNFTNDGQTFFVHNGNATINGDWEVSGLASKVIVGNGLDNITFTIPSAHFFVGAVDVTNNGSLQLGNVNIPSLENLATGSTVIYNENALAIQYNDYHNLIIDDINPVFIGDGQINISGDLTLTGTVAMPDARGADLYNIRFDGDGAQTINTNSNILRAYNLQFIKTTGTVSVASGSTLSADNQTTFNLAAGTLYEDNGATHYAGNSVNISGDENAYNFTGTLVLAEEITGVVKGDGDANNFNIREGGNSNIVAALNNVTISSVNAGGEFRFRDGSTNVVSIKGNFTVEPQVEGLIRFYSNDVKLGGDFVIQNGFNGSFNAINTLTIEGASTQTLSPDFSGFSVDNLIIDKPSGDVEVDANILVNNSLSMESGIVHTNLDETIRLAASAVINSFSNSSFISGPFDAEVNSASNTALVFPIGKGTQLRSAILNVAQTNADAAWYRAEMFNDAGSSLSLSSELSAVSTVRHYMIEQLNPVDVDGFGLTLNYDADDNVSDPSELRIAYAEATEWISLGGFGSAATTGTITTTANFVSLGEFTLATANSTTIVPEIFVTPATLSQFAQDLGTPSAEQILTIQGSNLEGDIEITAPANFEISLTSGSGFENTLTLNETAGIVAATAIYIRLNSAAVGNFAGDITFTSDNATTITRAVEGETTEIITPPELDLIYYWHFNDLEAPDANVTVIEADYSLIPGFVPVMTYNGNGANDMDEFSPGSLINVQLSEPAGKAARVRNPSEDRSLDFNFNTSGCSDLVMEYAVHRSGQGMLFNIVSYSLDGGATFSQSGLPNTSFEISESYELVTIDFTNISGANDNPNFIVRIEWQGNTSAGNGNNRYDNITLKGNAENVSIEENNFEAYNVLVYPNPASTILNIETGVKTNEVSIIDMTGKVVSRFDLHFAKNQINIEHLPNGVYSIILSNDTDIKQIKFIKK